jgi:AP-1 complex subunit gamma-1
VQKLYAALKDDITQEGLTLAGSWVIGEFGDALLRGGQYEEEELVKEVKESDIVDLFETILGSSYAGLIVQQYIVTASIKLTTRLTEPAQIERLRRLLQRYNTNLDVEIQQRAVEYGNLFGQDQVRRGVLEKMPAPEIREEQRVLGEATKKRQSKILKKKPAQAATEDLLLDLMGDSGPSADTNGTAHGAQHSQDLLADILGGDSSASSPPPQTSTPGPQSNVANIMDLFNSGPSSSPAPTQSRPPPQAGSMDLLGGMPSSSQPPAPSAASGPAAHPVYNKNDLQIAFQMKRDANAIQLLARFRNTGSISQLSAVNLQAAVPKSQKLQLQPISTAELDAGQEATQQMRVTSVNGVSLTLISDLYYTNNSLASASQVTIEAEGYLFCRQWPSDGTGRLVRACLSADTMVRWSITCRQSKRRAKIAAIMHSWQYSTRYSLPRSTPHVAWWLEFDAGLGHGRGATEPGDKDHPALGDI